MWRLRHGFCFITLLLLCSLATSLAARGSRSGASSKWLTLTGEPPLVIARGGFSGFFADSSSYAYRLALLYGLSNLHVWCDVQLTKDATGICFPYIRLDNGSNIADAYPHRKNTYEVGGNSESGWFSPDFTFKELALVNLQQGIYTRAPYFDGTPMSVLSVQDVINLSPPGLWLNFQNVAFFKQHNLSSTSFVTSVSRNSTIHYISSPDADFLRAVSRLGLRQTKLIFQFLGPDEIEPSTRQTYESLKSNLTFIKSFASGILVPKTYIWPQDERLYLKGSTPLVLDAHNSGLAVFASDFVNDVPLLYNYSFDPVNENLNFIDNNKFSVDGLLSNFPLTSSASVDCFSHMSKNDTVQEKFLIISSEGASVDYPGCTDLAYEKAVSGGADILDCPVQVTSDGVPFCLASINLKDRTMAAESPFSDRVTSNADLGITNGIFAYSLTWKDIQTMKPQISNPYYKNHLYRNPSTRNEGKLIQLSEFLSFANNASSIHGVIIGIENAVYLAEKQGLGVTKIVLDALDQAGYSNQTAKKVMIKSSDSAVLKNFKSTSTYELVYDIKEDARDILNGTILEITKFANAVVITKGSVFPLDGGVIINQTSIVPKLQAFNLTVYVGRFRNEFISQAWDFFCDPYMEINTHLNNGINGVITDYPASSSRFRRNRCLGYKDLPNYMSPVQPGGLLQLMSPDQMPPAEAPSPILEESDVVEPPLPPVRAKAPVALGTGNGSTSSAQPPRSNGVALLASRCVFFSIVSVVCAATLL